MTLSGGYVYAGGTFVTAGNANANSLAQWDGTNWTSRGTGVTNDLGVHLPTVSAITVNGSDLYVGGAFTKAGGMDALSIGGGGELYVAGTFDRAGLKPSSFLGILHPPGPPSFKVAIAELSGGRFILKQSLLTHDPKSMVPPVINRMLHA